ncbi:bifunctional folylpolyglutamate synthase/dihydrofolate synthase [Enemella sp. A6]|uniref:bifunctional folylpolyglutamate synthase/dihydrofolate synthase n=1 Tax=Enemella sp. A6 TaxID=3440152 RepID=UPI003EB87946
MEQHARLVAELTGRWPENRVAPSLTRISALCGLLGDPQHATPVIHLTGTNGKGSTGAIIDALLRSVGLRTGRFSSPHLSDLTERISIDGQPIGKQDFADLWEQVAPMVQMVDEQRLDGVPMTFFEVMTGLAFAAFADAPVDVAIVEVGLGGRWDATNVADAQVAVLTPISLDHTHLLGDDVVAIAEEKAGIIKEGACAVLAGQEPEVAKALLRRCAEVGAKVITEGVDFAVLDRTLAVGGQVIRIDAHDGPVGELHLPLHGAHQAHNAALAVAAVEAFLGETGLDPQVIQDGLDEVRSPGRLELVRRSPSIVLDAAHNPHGARAAAEALTEAFSPDPLVLVFAVMRDKDADEMLRVWDEVATEVVITRVAGTDRAMPVDDLAEQAEGIFGATRVHRAERLDDAIELATARAEALAGSGGQPGVLVTGSVIAVGQARTLLVGDEPTPAEPVELEVGAPHDPDAAFDEALRRAFEEQLSDDHVNGHGFGEGMDR